MKGRNHDDPVVTTTTGRIVVYEGVTAVYDRNANTITITEDGKTYVLDLNVYNTVARPQQARRAVRGTVIREKNILEHKYQYVKGPANNDYWVIDIPSFSFNINEWCGPITVYENIDDRRAIAACERFKAYIDRAKDAESMLIGFGGAVLLSAVAAYVTKNTEFTKQTFFATCLALGIAVNSNVAEEAGMYIASVRNARDEYYAAAALI